MNNGIYTGIDTDEDGVYLVRVDGVYFIRVFNYSGYGCIDIPAVELKQWLNENLKDDL
jgi:hypothetical protein